ncbi:DUF2167 domain-containing protein [Pedobacter sp. HMF7647]|uniref:DUF2167 domain-containing protein n=1 Tax=Hufsiella arboris TaxID=2695275 RepID=A0A7K1Y6H8_9SPHI|nr:DUF2167 domain-containing protein [Hufsiella arboris]MXV50177.1 DUF2167 domain-containing protein [Hufsiella arboris]
MKISLIFATTLISVACQALAKDVDSIQIKRTQIEKSFHYQTGTVKLETNNATLNVPQGFKFLNKKEGMVVLSDIWNNPPDSTILGLLVPAKTGVTSPDSWAFVLSFDKMGYVKDDDAESINYDDLLKEQQKNTEDANSYRIANGYEKIQLVGWASAPFYDKNANTLHWAKEIKFGTDSTNTLNYNIRILGRKGIFLLNAVAGMDQLPLVKQNIDKVIQSVEFDKGHRYADFVPEVDNVAAWTVGGLVAGKVLAKAGFFVLLLKFWKLLLVGIAAAVGAVKRFFGGRKNTDSIIEAEPLQIQETSKTEELADDADQEKERE